MSNDPVRVLVALLESADALAQGVAVPEVLESVSLAHGIDRTRLADLLLVMFVAKDRARVARASESGE